MLQPWKVRRFSQSHVYGTLLPNVHLLEYASFKLSYHREWCVPRLQLVKKQGNVVANRSEFGARGANVFFVLLLLGTCHYPQVIYSRLWVWGGLWVVAVLVVRIIVVSECAIFVFSKPGKVPKFHLHSMFRSSKKGCCVQIVNFIVFRGH